MPLLKSKSKKAQSKNIETEMKAGKPQDQAIAISYDIMRRAKKRKMAQGGLVHPEQEKSLMESKITDHFPTYDSRKGPDPMGYSSSKKRVESDPHNSPNTDEDDLSLQQRMVSRPSDKQNRSNVLFDGKAERIDPMAAEMKENYESEMRQYGEDPDDEAADDIVSRIMRKMKRK